MVLVIYKGNVYPYWESIVFGYNIVTERKEKCFEEFLEDDTSYHLPISLDNEEIKDVFTEKIHFYYDDNGLFVGENERWAHWELTVGAGSPIKNGRILLNMTGYVPGWEIVNKLECEKYVEVSEFKDVYRKRIYTKKDGVFCKEPVEEIVSMTFDEIDSYMSEYEDL